MSNQLIQIVDRTAGQNEATELAPETKPLDLATVRAKLAERNGQGYWRSLEELADDPDFSRFLEREFPRQAPRDMAPLPRRDFLKLMGAALALAGVSGCAFQPQEEIVPYVREPEELTPGIPLFYSTAYTRGGYAMGVLAESYMGRPIKIEGNPDHPSSLGATDAFAQAEVLSLYDPDRSQTLRKLGSTATWNDFVGTMRNALDAQGARRGAGLHILTETITSPTMADQMSRIKALFPAMTWHQYEPISRDTVREGNRLAFGSGVETLPNFAAADVILSLDSNFLLEEPGSVRYAREFANKRRVRRGTTNMNRLYTVESSPTITGAMADHCWRVKASQVENMARAIAAQLGVAGVTGGTLSGDAQKWVATLVQDLQANRGRSLVVAGQHQTTAVHVLAHAINNALGNIGKTVIGIAPVEAQPQAQVQSLRNLHSALKAGQVDILMILGGNPLYNAPADLDFQSLLDPDKNVGPDKTPRTPLSVHLSQYDDETSEWCTWHIPQTHFLESWSDARGHDGTVSIVQPLIQPLYPDTRSAHEVLSALTPTADASLSTRDLVQSYWRRTRPANFDKQWQVWLHEGIVPGTAAAPRPLSLRAAALTGLPAPAANAGGMEIMFRPDPTIWDGRYANNAWLQELPKPLTKITWDNAALMSIGTAERLKVTDDDLVNLKVNGRTIQAAVYIQPGHPDEAVTLHLGYGRWRAGKLGTSSEPDLYQATSQNSGDMKGTATGVGFNAYALRTSENLWFAQGLEVTSANERYRLARTAHHNLIETRKNPQGQKVGDEKVVDGIHNRPLVQTATFAQFKENPSFVHIETQKALPVIGEIQQGNINFHKEEAGHGEGGSHGNAAGHDAGAGGVAAGNTHGNAAPPGKDAHGDKPAAAHGAKAQGYPSLYPDSRDTVLNDEEVPYAWAMAIDTSLCIGCNACVIACQAENNSATTGKHQVMMGRDLHWLRIDTYYYGDVDNPETYFAPVLCMHCEKAPCEPVCPVEATLHSPEGLNEMVYNRCIGTRYCSNNCPYKVRRFNYLQYSQQNTPQFQLMANPDVTVRSRGVMEKCTYCVQRIAEARIQAEKENRLVADGDVLTACQQACPTRVITFGDIKNPNSAVSLEKKQPHNYGMLTELNTYPRTTYLAKVTNPNPALTVALSNEDAETSRAHRPADAHKAGEGDAAYGSGIAPGADNDDGKATSKH
jgi:molybdopterin-containing oxidoreductase family iron-sulfur binding subunit